MIVCHCNRITSADIDDAVCCMKTHCDNADLCPEEESIEEMGHADAIITRIIFLGGHPNLQTLGSLRIGQDVKEILECDLVGEYEAHESYSLSTDVCKAERDFVSQNLFEDSLKDEEGHIDFLETQLDLLERVGLQNYQQLQADSANSAG